MNALLETLGEEGTRRFLTFVLPQFEERSTELLAHLRSGNWQAAATCAHRLKGTIHLYASADLLDDLYKIKSDHNAALQNENFLQGLEQKLTHAHQEIRIFLSGD
ncbi:MAG TPA: hypothetical protein PLE99_16050 [Candidatus Thiothrix moscowensis]|uniref:hypothetical protein n=1 Tax=unclassified Thiothrix TaxID=2636184 RepID=UPI0025F31C3F|nr:MULTISPECIES: hypothetical protein [unclassified Thiothrix]HRJ54273.1 hypothetical protein [Candidatus Thiothrix moscowensis]HRJ94539.1 hypothetical protein [Candidatus Thiothrix moscowensis]